VEAEFIEWLRDRVAASSAVLTGIGDDAAIIRLPGPLAVLTSDMLMDGVDFELESADMRRIGRKALAVNLSDVAAMACRPVAAVISLALPLSRARWYAEEFYAGLLPLAEKYSVAVAGGDTNTWNGPFVVNITLLGTPPQAGPALRSGGQVGDEILVTGEFGGSILGRHFDFEPRVAEAIWLREHEEVHAAIDVSDGLSLDLFRLAAASSCGAEIDLSQIPISAAAHELAEGSESSGSALDHALSDGEDFELVLAVEAESAARLVSSQPLSVPLTRIGRLVAEPGLWQISPGNPRAPLKPRGWEY
jgi:thiamine-monophosphate kinase